MRLIKIPFCGFYESLANADIDYAIESSFDHEGTGCPDIPDEFWSKWDGTTVYNAFAKHYLESFEAHVSSELGTDIKFVFKELESPRFYNYGTDKIFADISKEDILKISKLVNSEMLTQVIENRCTSCDGFCSFYPNDIAADIWQTPVTEWDHNQLGILLEALTLSTDTSVEYSDIMGSPSCSWAVDSIVWDNAPQDCLDILNQHYTDHESRIERD